MGDITSKKLSGKVRREHDLLGEMNIPEEYYFGVQTMRALENFYAREDTLSIGICNGCQLMVELGLVGKNDGARMLHNDTHRFESAFLGVEIGGGRSVMLDSLNGSRLGVWISHGEGKFSLPKGGNIVMKYCSDEYPANPNGSDFAAAAIASADGRHLAPGACDTSLELGLLSRRSTS